VESVVDVKGRDELGGKYAQWVGFFGGGDVGTY
jgi:hypothetical protein